MSTKKLQVLGSFGNKVYTQNEEPTDAVDGSVWITMDSDSTKSSRDIYAQNEEPINAVEGSVWIDLDDDSAGNSTDADTLDGYHASDFAMADHTHDVATSSTTGLMTSADKIKLDSVCDDVADLNAAVGDTSVSEQITQALANFSSGKTLTEHLTEENIVLTSLQYGDTLPEPGVAGRLFFKRVSV